MSNSSAGSDVNIYICKQRRLEPIPFPGVKILAHRTVVL